MTNHPNRSKYAIHCNPGYYVGDLYGRDKGGLVRGSWPIYRRADDGVIEHVGYREDEIVALRSREDAETVARMLNDHGDGPYLLDHNQHSAPVYSVKRYRGSAPAISIKTALVALQLQYDFRQDGSRISSAA